jgi:hypothetical protein
MNDTGFSAMTVARAREQLHRWATPGDKNAPEFLRALNEVSERIHTGDDWYGRTGIWSVALNAGILTLPPFLEAALKVKIDTKDARLFGQSHQFLVHGPGDSTKWGALNIEDKGEVASEVVFPSTGGTLSVVSTSAADVASGELAAPVLRFHGTDVNGQRIIDADGISGEEVTLNGTTPVATTNSFYSCQGFQKPRTRGRVTVTRDTTDLAVLEPWDLDPIYRRYDVKDTAATTALVWARRRFRMLANEEDQVLPANVGALKMGLMALENENKGHLDASLKYWGRCFALLNASSSAKLGGVETYSEFPYDTPGVEPISDLEF